MPTIRTFALFFLLTSFAPAFLFAQTAEEKCAKYQKSMKLGEACMNSKRYPDALKAFQSAIIAARECNISTRSPAINITRITEALNKQKVDAEKSRDSVRTLDKKANSMTLLCAAYVGIYQHNEPQDEGFYYAEAAYREDPGSQWAKNALYACLYVTDNHSLAPYGKSTQPENDNIQSAFFSGDTLVTIGDTTFQKWNLRTKTSTNGLCIRLDNKHVATDWSDPDSITICNLETGISKRVTRRMSSHLFNFVYTTDERNMIVVSDNCIDVWSAEAQKRMISICPPGTYTPPILSEDGTRAAAILDNATIIINTLTGEVTDSIRFTNAPSFIAFSPKNKYLFISYANFSAYLYDINNKKTPPVSLEKIEMTPISIVFSPDLQRYIIIYEGGTARTGKTNESKLETYSEQCNFACFSPLNTEVITVSGNIIKLWNTDNCTEEKATIKGHKEEFSLAGFSPDGKKIWATTSNEVRLWSIDTVKENGILHGDWEKASYATFYNKADKVFIVNGTNGSIQSTSGAASDLSPVVLKNPLKQGTQAIFSPDGKALITIDTTCTLKVWNTANGDSLCETRIKSNKLFPIRFSPDAKKLYKIFRDTVYIKKIPIGNLKKKSDETAALDSMISTDTVMVVNLADRKIYKKGLDSVSSLMFSSDGSHLMTMKKNGTLCAWDMTYNEPVHIKTIPNYYSSVFSGDGTRKMQENMKPAILVKYQDSRVQVYTIVNEKKFKISDVGTCDTGFFSANGNRLLTIRREADSIYVKIVDVENTDDSLCYMLSSASGRLPKVWFSPDNRLCYVSDNSITTVLSTVKSVQIPVRDVKNMSYSSDNRFVLYNLKSGSQIYAVREISDYPTGTQTKIFPKCDLPKMDSAIFSPDGNYLLTKYNSVFKLWDISRLQKEQDNPEMVAATPNLIGTPAAVSSSYAEEIVAIPIGAARRYFFSKDSKRIYTQYADGSCKIWLIDLDELIRQR